MMRYLLLLLVVVLLAGCAAQEVAVPSNRTNDTVNTTDESVDTTVDEVVYDAGCGEYTAEELHTMWKAAFMDENDLTEADFTDHITVLEVISDHAGINCELRVRYNATVEWVSVQRVDDILYPVEGELELTRESGPQGGRSGVSSMMLTEDLAFATQAQAVDYLLDETGHAGTEVRTARHNFQYHWNVEREPTSVGSGGEPILTISGAIDESANRCYQADLSLLSRQTYARESPCMIA